MGYYINLLYTVMAKAAAAHLYKHIDTIYTLIYIKICTTT